MALDLVQINQVYEETVWPRSPGFSSQSSPPTRVSLLLQFKILIYDLKRERNVFVYVFCFVVFVFFFFFFVEHPLMKLKKRN